MDSTGVLSLLEQLDDDVDILEESLAPILKHALSETASKLPLLDKAKLFVLVTYAIESVLFSYFRLNGVKAREHPVFTELTRVKQYFEKIKIAETPITNRENNPVVDQQAARRFIKSGLTGNDKYDLERAEREAKAKAKAHIKFEQLEKKRKAEIEDSEPASDSDESSDDSGTDSAALAELPNEAVSPFKTKKVEKSKSVEGSEAEPRKSKKRNKKKRKNRNSKETK